MAHEFLADAFRTHESYIVPTYNTVVVPPTVTVELGLSIVIF